LLQQARAFGTENNILLGSNNQTTSEVLYGTSSGDNIIAYGGMSDQVYGYAGDDILFGGNGLDKLYGGIGNDSYYFNSGDAIQIGASHYEDSFDQVNENRNEGLDVIYFARGIHPDAVLLWTDGTGSLFIKYSETDIIRIKGSITGESGAYYTSRVSEHLEQIIFDDETVWDLTQGLHLRNENTGRTIYGSAYNDTIQGGSATDHLYGFAGDDILYGYDATDYLFGGEGQDILYGGTGNDTLRGENGNDTLYGGSGVDTLYGGAGSDRFVFESDSAFSNVDTIADFSLAQNDVIDISDLLALYDPLSHAITDFVSITQSGSNSALFVDRDGAGAGYGAQQIATISGVTGITDVAALIANGHLDITP
jgi:Ca2+-binding RTX toxin-like protein